ncbi:MAG TPA: hypothetical protein VNU01_07520, partial [Egibacteraceae bacterium]|nr:hypothetical protein [Egibacteraceae bacterium]
MAMAMMQPPGETEFATRQDVQRVDEKVDRVGEQVRRLETGFERMEEKLDAVLTVMREHMASKADVERMGRIMTIWVVGAITALIGIMLTTMWN